MSHYFDADPSTPSERRAVSLTLPDLTVELVADRGVFSGERVDPGTRLLLLEAPAPPETGDVLDLGCGYGPVAVALAHRSPGATVWAVDVNERARQLTAENAEGLGLTNVRVAAPDDIAADVRFAAVYSNPPIRIGKAALHELLLRWLGRLTPDGAAWLVVQKHLGSDSLAAWLEKQGYTALRLCSRAGYRILEVRPSAGGER